MIVFLDICAAGTEINSSNLSTKGKERYQDRNNHKPIVFIWIFIMGLEKLIRKIENTSLFIVDELV